MVLSLTDVEREGEREREGDRDRGERGISKLKEDIDIFLIIKNIEYYNLLNFYVLSRHDVPTSAIVSLRSALHERTRDGPSMQNRQHDERVGAREPGIHLVIYCSYR